MVELVNDVAEGMTTVLQRKGQRLRLGQMDAAMADADPARITQVLTNLIENAHKYAGADTDITIDVLRAGGAVRVTVSDSGPGLPEGSLERAFRPYERIGRQGAGLGLGLWVVRSIIETHTGQVGAANRPGGGASFWFDLRESAAGLGAPAQRQVMTKGMTAA
jgi:signal transduction histidine kinase